MTRKILWLMVSFLLVAALVLSSCAKEEVVGEQEEEEEEEEEEVVGEEEEEEPAVGVPQYGGTLTYVYWYWGDATTADTFIGYGAPNHAQFVLDRAIMGDFAKYGPRGTGEFAFQNLDDVPLKYCKGALAESWDVTADRIILRVRPGVYWAAYGKENIMESREVTADDFVYSLMTYTTESPACGPPGWYWTENGGYIDAIYADDRYTVVIETSRFDCFWYDKLVGWSSSIYPPESHKADLSDWNNLVGSGPFMVKEHVSGSFMSYDRNPHYWDTATINGVEYELPFIDELVYPFIPDESSQVAVLQTGKIDAIWILPVVYEDTLKQTAPELILMKAPHFQATTMALNMYNEIFAYNKDVRRALVMAVDREAVLKAGYGPGGDHLAFPISSQVPGVYTPFDELPLSTQEMLTYDPVKAKQLLADAGYPEGFALKVVLGAGSFTYIDMASMVKEYWREIGVELKLETLEETAYANFQVGQAEAGLLGVQAIVPYDCLFGEATHNAPLRGLLSAFGLSEENWANYHDPYFDEQFALARATIDEDERDAILKKAAVYALDDAAYVPFGAPTTLRCWWPWVKNYYGEADLATFYMGPLIAHIWIDQDLKAEMGYK